jgi:hypothetical protein
VRAASLSEGVHSEVHDRHGILVHDVHQQPKGKKGNVAEGPGMSTILTLLESRCSSELLFSRLNRNHFLQCCGIGGHRYNADTGPNFIYDADPDQDTIWIRLQICRRIQQNNANMMMIYGSTTLIL